MQSGKQSGETACMWMRLTLTSAGHDLACLIAAAVFLTGSDAQLHSLHPHLLVHVRVLRGQATAIYNQSAIALDSSTGTAE